MKTLRDAAILAGAAFTIIMLWKTPMTDQLWELIVAIVGCLAIAGIWAMATGGE